MQHFRLEDLLVLGGLSNIIHQIICVHSSKYKKLVGLQLLFNLTVVIAS